MLSKAKHEVHVLIPKNIHRNFKLIASRRDKSYKDLLCEVMNRFFSEDENKEIIEKFGWKEEKRNEDD